MGILGEHAPHDRGKTRMINTAGRAPTIGIRADGLNVCQQKVLAASHRVGECQCDQTMPLRTGSHNRKNGNTPCRTARARVCCPPLHSLIVPLSRASHNMILIPSSCPCAPTMSPTPCVCVCVWGSAPHSSLIQKVIQSLLYRWGRVVPWQE